MTGPDASASATTGGGDRTFATIRYEVADAIATITLDRPDALNALTIEMKGELLRALGLVARDRAVRAVVLTGAGRAFCAGQDLKERQSTRRGPARGRAARALQPDHPGDARARPADRRGDQRRRRRRRARRSPSPATCGSPPRAPASCSRSGGSASCPTAARRGSCRGSSVRPRPPSWPCSATRSRRRTRSGSGWSRGSCPARRSRPRRARWRRVSPPWRRRALAATKRALDRAWTIGSRPSPRGRGVSPGRRRGEPRSRRGDGGLPREAPAAVHRGVAEQAHVLVGARRRSGACVAPRR